MMTTVLSPRSRAGCTASLLPLLVWAVGCAFNPSGASGGDGSLADAGPGGPDRGDGSGLGGDDGEGAGCGDLLPFLPSNTGCDLGEVSAPITLDDISAPYLFDTDLARLTRPDGTSDIVPHVFIEQRAAPEICLVATTSFTIGAEARLTVVGQHALAVVSTGDLTVDGVLDSGASVGRSGPGGDDSETCVIGRGRVGQIQSRDALQVAGSGGGGGGFADSGGDGAPVADSDQAEETEGGEAEGSPDLVPLRGGCAGGRGGFGSANSGLAGGAGGALQLVAGGTIRVDGIVTARGGGGGGINTAFDGGGGGGGGSGGGLLFEATRVEVNGAVTANGGGGGAGSRTANATSRGADGLDGVDTRAPGGTDLVGGGDGGSGGAADGQDGEDGLEGESVTARLAGGGGGGGSAGRIRLRALAGRPVIGDLAVVSPAAQ